MLSFLTIFATIPIVSHLLADTPWNELVAFLNTLVKTESQIQSQSQAQNVTQPQNIHTLFSTGVVPKGDERSDELPLPEDYVMLACKWCGRASGAKCPGRCQRALGARTRYFVHFACSHRTALLSSACSYSLSVKQGPLVLNPLL
jgi:hypothetical protein